MWYTKPSDDANVIEWVDFETGEWTSCKAEVSDTTKATFRTVTLLMSSAIIGKGGSDTGELLVAYPMSSVHTVEVG